MGGLLQVAGGVCQNYDEVADLIAQRYEEWRRGGRRGPPPDTSDIYAQQRETPITLDIVIQAGHDFLDSGRHFTQLGEEGLRDTLFDKEKLEAFWRHWSVVTGRIPQWRTEGEWWQIGPKNPFSCSC